MSEDFTFKQVDSIIEQIVKMREQVESKENEISELNKQLTNLKQQAVGILEGLERDSYQSPLGTIYRAKKISIATPKTWEEKQAFLEYLKGKGGDTLAQSYITFNSNSLKSFVKAELDAREMEGNFDTTIPGLQPPTEYYDLGFRRK